VSKERGKVSDPLSPVSASLFSIDETLNLGLRAKCFDQLVTDSAGVELLKSYEVILATSSAPSELVNVVGLFRFAVPEPLGQEVVQFPTANEALLDSDYNFLHEGLPGELSALQRRDPEVLRVRLNDLLPPETTYSASDIAERLFEATGQRVRFELINPTIGPVIPTLFIPLRADREKISEQSLDKERGLVIERRLSTYTPGPLEEEIDFHSQPVFVKVRSFSFYEEGQRFAELSASRER